MEVHPGVSATSYEVKWLRVDSLQIQRKERAQLLIKITDVLSVIDREWFTKMREPCLMACRPAGGFSPPR